MRYCGSLDLDHLLHQPFAHLGRLVRDEHSGQPLPPVEVAARAVLLRAAGYECHALEFVQTGRYLTTYAEQMEKLRTYITDQLDDARPVLKGHSQGGTKVLQYLLAET